MLVLATELKSWQLAYYFCSNDKVLINLLISLLSASAFLLSPPPVPHPRDSQPVGSVTGSRLFATSLFLTCCQSWL